MTHCSLCSPHRSALPLICLQIDDLQEGGGGESGTSNNKSSHGPPTPRSELSRYGYHDMSQDFTRQPAALTHMSSCVPAVCVPCHGRNGRYFLSGVAACSADASAPKSFE